MARQSSWGIESTPSLGSVLGSTIFAVSAAVEAGGCASVSDADPGLGPTDDDAGNRSGVAAFDPISSSGNPYDVKSKKSAGSTVAAFSLGDELPMVIASMKLELASDESPLSSGIDGYAFRISSNESAISVFRLSPDSPSLLVTWLSQLVICSKNFIASSSVFTASASCCRFDMASLGGSSHSVLIFFAAGAADAADNAAASSSRGRLEPTDSGVGAFAGVAGVAGGLISDGPAEGLAALAAGVAFADGFRGFDSGFGFGLVLGDFGVCGELTTCVGVAAAGVSAEGFGVGFLRIGVPVTRGGEAADGV